MEFLWDRLHARLSMNIWNLKFLNLFKSWHLLKPRSVQMTSALRSKRVANNNNSHRQTARRLYKRLKRSVS